jgi:hypothetical protein
MVHINFMVHADDVNLLGESIGTTKKKDRSSVSR